MKRIPKKFGGVKMRLLHPIIDHLGKMGFPTGLRKMLVATLIKYCLHPMLHIRLFYAIIDSEVVFMQDNVFNPGCLSSKICRVCGKEFPISQFGWNGHNGRINVCDECIKERAKKRRDRQSEFINDIKRGYGCCRCGEKEPAALLFHHIDPTAKTGSLSSMKGYSLKKILEEIAKCDVMCFNCHAKAHAGIIPFCRAKTK